MPCKILLNNYKLYLEFRMKIYPKENAEMIITSAFNIKLILIYFLFSKCPSPEGGGLCLSP